MLRRRTGRSCCPGVDQLIALGLNQNLTVLQQAPGDPCSDIGVNWVLAKSPVPRQGSGFICLSASQVARGSLAETRNVCGEVVDAGLPGGEERIACVWRRIQRAEKNTAHCCSFSHCMSAPPGEYLQITRRFGARSRFNNNSRQFAWVSSPADRPRAAMSVTP